MEDYRKIINIGILAHVDAGKTSITEQMLFKSGVTRSLGNVDKGTSQTDWLPVERERGISVRAASASFVWNNTRVNLIDTPGHSDFAAEVERVLPALDAAILVISAVEGIQAQTDTLWQVLQKLHIPTILFVNKIDRDGADIKRLNEELRLELSAAILPLQSVTHESRPDVMIRPLLSLDGGFATDQELAEQIISRDDELLGLYLQEETITDKAILTALIKQMSGQHVFPLLYGSAKYDLGMVELLDMMVYLMPKAGGNPHKALSGIVFKVEHDKLIGRVASVRLFDGSVSNRDSIFFPGRQLSEKVSQIRKLLGQKYEDVGELHAGDIGAICGLTAVRAGDIIGAGGDKEPVTINTALLTLQVHPAVQEDYPALVSALQQLGDEDPSLELLWLKDERALHLRIMGLIQLEILEAVLEERFGLKVSFDEPVVIYKETPAGKGEGFEAYTMPKPCWAVLRFLIEPGKRGSGVEYHSVVGVNAIAAKYQNEIERTIPLALRQGIQGWELTDLKITLIEGEDHVMHSRPGDFAIATPMAILSGLQQIGTTLLEPMLSFTITAPEQMLGKIVGSLSQLRASFEAPAIRENKFTLTGIIPVASSLDYAVKLSALTGGKGKFVTRFAGYSECEENIDRSVPYRGISPLDRSRYILKARKALQ
ncbi:MAG: TetM/TetW/TetO/TetS family tetracycline resistance ribosomal protection protein [Bacteroidetes bacterium]|jgi:small GTP-binding protein|nr:TetM/TetW/TetO/TetS family tetracycline resistance ribosomal protection protein [Bacteroidota bacterium]